MGPGCGGKANYRCNKCNVVWAQDVVGRPTTGVTSVTLCGPRVWWKTNYRCNKCNVVWAQDVVGKPTTGWWLNSWGCIAIFFIVIYFFCSAVSNPRDCSKRFTFHPLADLFIPNPPHLFWEAFAHSAISARNYCFKYPHMPLASYSFVQLNELWQRNCQIRNGSKSIPAF